MAGWRVRPAGPAAVLVELTADSGWSPATLASALAHDRAWGRATIVPGATTVLVDGSAASSGGGAELRERIATWLERSSPDVAIGRGASPEPGDEVVEIATVYDGRDLGTVAAQCGMTTADVVAAHTAGDYVVAFCGFAPGFAYLAGLDPRLVLPRRATPRPRVPPGSVAIAAGYSAVYPGESPGGWHLLGRTSPRLFDPASDPPSRLRPGTRVRFVAHSDLSPTETSTDRAAPDEAATVPAVVRRLSAPAALTVVRRGLATTFQDAGRPGFEAVGVSRSGACDPALAGLVNRLVGNPAGAAVIETAGGLIVRAERALTVAVSREPGARSVPAGTEIAVEPADGEMWGYLAVGGGFAVEPVLGSGATDTLGGLGPPPLVDAQAIAVAPGGSGPLLGEPAGRRLPAGPITVWPGPRADWVTGGVDAFVASTWIVGDVSRVGVRLSGPPLGRATTAELPSEPLVAGAIQVPPDGQPIIMLADHPTTGGYPVVGVVDPAHLVAVAQARPGQVLRCRSAPAGWR